ncbi:MAG: hypothetical protein JW908_10505 [Anaerolineales bacterium]|nr:hypothetical protein [Anaerolineales bacterium]
MKKNQEQYKAHTYNENLALAIYFRLESYARLMEEWLFQILNRLEV